MLNRIRTFMPRQGRLSQAQRAAIERLSERYALKVSDCANASFIQSHAPLVLEIGFGMGDALWQSALQHPEWHFLGAEVHTPGFGTLFQALESNEIENVRAIQCDVFALFNDALPRESLSRVHIFFPDPWQKKRHHKRRLIQAAFLKMLEPHLKPGAILRLATDWEDYAIQMEAELEAYSGLTAVEDAYQRPETKFERRGKRLGHQIYDFSYSYQPV